MPCDSSHMNATYYERDISRVACLLDELSGAKFSHSHWEGYHPNVYGSINKEKGDQMVSALCQALQKEDVSKRSLEMQMWWRDHQEADKARIVRELQEAKTQEDKRKAIEKLTPYERDILGL